MRFRTLALVAATLLTLSACSSEPEEGSGAQSGAGEQGSAPSENTDAPHTDQSEPTNYSYVALGDSYAAMGSNQEPTTGPGPCVRSADNYPGRLLEAENIEGIDSTCSGAETEHVTGPWAVGGETIPPQVEALSRDTTLVTLSIGGNDISFGGIVDCFVDAFRASTPTDCASALRQTVDGDLVALPGKLDAVHRDIAGRAPDARVIVTGYVPLVTATGACSDVPTMSLADRRWIVDLTGRLNRTVEQAAQRAGASFVLPSDANSHTGCAPAPERWVDFFGTETQSYPMHPTPVGQEAMASAVEAELEAG